MGQKTEPDVPPELRRAAALLAAAVSVVGRTTLGSPQVNHRESREILLRANAFEHWLQTGEVPPENPFQ